MKFVIEKISKSSGRLGHLVQSDASKKMTPLLMQTTKGGSIPFISRDVFNHISKDAQILQMSVATMDHMTEALTMYDGSLGSYVGFKEHLNFLTIRDPCETMPSGMNDKDVVPLFTRRGKEPLTAKKFMDLIEIFSPDIYQGLCDADTNYESSKKRVQKSVDRTQQFMDYCYERHKNSEKLKNIALFAPIVGGYNTFARSQSIQHSKTQPEHVISGYFFEGFHNYGLSATEIRLEKLLDIMKHCLKETDVNKPKIMPGAYTPLAILELIRLGVDFFDSSYAYCAAINFKALIFNFDLNMNSTALVLLDLTNEDFKEDFSPLLSNCTCLACSKHTRAYVHHLYKTNELLGPILLMMHNLHHLLAFFETIRSCIECDKIPELIELIKYQSQEDEIDYRIQENKKEVSKTGIGKMFTSEASIEARST